MCQSGGGYASRRVTAGKAGVFWASSILVTYMVTPAGRHPFWRGVVLPRRREPRFSVAAPDALEPRLPEGTGSKLAATGIDVLKHVPSFDFRLGLHCPPPTSPGSRRGIGR